MTSSRTAPRADDLAAEAIALWRLARSRGFHGPGCGCCGAQPVLVDPATLLEDVEFALLHRYRSADHAAERCVVERAGATAGGHFSAWVAVARDAGPAGAVVLNDVLATLASMTGRPGGGA